MQERTLDRIVEDLRYAQERQAKGALFIGAGCSFSAGIPLASGIVELIREKFSAAHAQAANSSYAACMAQLTPAQRHALIADLVDRAKLNWAHIAIAQLVKHGFIDRVLTTNFDPLLAKACAMAGVFPAIYDLAMAPTYMSEYVPASAIFHLHGQRSGFALMHTDEEVAAHVGVVEPVVEDTLQGRVLIVAGYSGGDPSFNVLGRRAVFQNRLYWVSHNSRLSDAVRDSFERRWKHAFHTPSTGADDFFVTLAQRLGCFPPDYVGRPFSYLDGLFDHLMSFEIPGPSTGSVTLEGARANIRESKDRYETASNKATEATASSKSEAMQAEALMLKGEYAEIVRLLSSKPTNILADTTRGTLAWAHTMLGNMLSNQARTKSGGEADALFTDAYAKFAEAVRIKPDMHEAFNNWGIALAAQARTKSGSEADALFTDTYARYAEAIRIKPDMHEAFNNWGSALLDQAKIKSGGEADALYKEATRFLHEAERLRPGAGAYNLACAAALQKEVENCRQWLEASARHGSLPKKAHLAADRDLDSVRETDWFAAILAQAPD